MKLNKTLRLLQKKDRYVQLVFDEALKKIKDATGKLSEKARQELKDQCDYFTENEDNLTFEDKLELLKQSIKTIDKDVTGKFPVFN